MGNADKRPEGKPEKKNTPIAAPRAPRDYNLNDEAAEMFAQEIITKCEELPLSESISFVADSIVTEKAMQLIDAHFEIDSVGKQSTTQLYFLLYAGKKNVQKRFHQVLKTVYYSKFY